MHADRILAPLFAHTMVQVPGVRLFDAHTHIGANDPDGFRCSADELLGALASATSRAVVFPMQEPSGYRRANDAVLEIARASEGRLVAFLGGTLGNFLPGSRRRFLRRLGEHLGPGGHALLGIDLVKDRDEVLAAYDDAEGVTAAFNRNVLAVLNERLGADFDLANFEHVARYDDHHDWIEMRLRALRACTVSVAALGLQVQFAAGEELRTEISAKFTRERFETDLRAGGLHCCAFFTDPGERFALVLCRAT